MLVTRIVVFDDSLDWSGLGYSVDLQWEPITGGSVKNVQNGSHAFI